MSRIRTLERAPVVPEVPTVAEAGYRSLNHDDLVGLFSTSGMSMEMRERIASDVRAILADPAVATRVAATGQIVSPGTPAESRPQRRRASQHASVDAMAMILGVGHRDRLGHVVGPVRHRDPRARKLSEDKLDRHSVLRRSIT